MQATFTAALERSAASRNERHSLRFIVRWAVNLITSTERGSYSSSMFIETDGGVVETTRADVR